MIRDFLRHMLIELTPACNLHCAHCYNGWQRTEADSPARGTYREAFRVLDFLIRRTTAEHLVFTGGEPTLAERFIELVVHALVNERQVTVISNGNGPRETYNRLAQLPVRLVELSLHAAAPALHDRMTGVAGSWERTMECAEVIRRGGIEVVPVLVLTAWNVDEVEPTLRFLAAEGFRQILVNRYNLAGGGAAALTASASQLREAFRQIDRLAVALGLTVSSGACTPHCLLDPADYPHIGFGSCSDNLYARPLTVDVKGNLRLCNHSPVVAGNIFRQPLEAIFSSSYAARWMELDLAACGACPRLAACRGGCRAAAEQLGLSLTARDPVVELAGCGEKSKSF